MLYIKEALKKRELTQIDLAERLGINRVSLSRLLSDKNDMRVSTIKKLANAIGCDVSEFFNPADKADHNVVTCPHCGAKLEINLSISDKKHE